MKSEGYQDRWKWMLPGPRSSLEHPKPGTIWSKTWLCFLTTKQRTCISPTNLFEALIGGISCSVYRTLASRTIPGCSIAVLLDVLPKIEWQLPKQQNSLKLLSSTRKEVCWILRHKGKTLPRNDRALHNGLVGSLRLFSVFSFCKQNGL